MGFPVQRPRRVRRNPMLRDLVRETALDVRDLVYPMFVVPGRGVARPVASMPGVCQLSVDRAVVEAREVRAPRHSGDRSIRCSAYRRTRSAAKPTIPRASVPSAVRAIRESVPDLCVITDVCLCEYTDHGHCGVLRGEEVDNDPTLEVLAREAVCHARAGAHVVAPSDMMDGRVGRSAARSMLPGFQICRSSRTRRNTLPDSTARFARQPNRRRSSATAEGYQMDPGNGDEALREIALDLEEGADMVMVKPALAIPRRHPPRAGAIPRRASCRVQRERRVRDVESRRRARLDRRRSSRRSKFSPRSDAPAPTSSSRTRRRMRRASSALGALDTAADRRSSSF